MQFNTTRKDFFSQKRANTDLQSFIIYIIFVIFILFVLLVFIRKSANGDILKEQVLAKQISLLIDISKPGTEISLHKDYFDVSIKTNQVTALSKKEDALSKLQKTKGYSYDFISKYNVVGEQKEAMLSIKISE
ncbi:MAG: hypothetical protein V1660_01545 [archaeon]